MNCIHRMNRQLPSLEELNAALEKGRDILLEKDTRQILNTNFNNQTHTVKTQSEIIDMVQGYLENSEKDLEEAINKRERVEELSPMFDNVAAYLKKHTLKSMNPFTMRKYKEALRTYNMLLDSADRSVAWLEGVIEEQKERLYKQMEQKDENEEMDLFHNSIRAKLAESQGLNEERAGALKLAVNTLRQKQKEEAEAAQRSINKRKAALNVNWLGGKPGRKTRRHRGKRVQKKTRKH
jgi:hypothetical protein